jgi:D-allulose-6-phosphate 3-epimerase
MNLARFEEQIRFLSTKADFLHFDVMDGHYVPALALSPLVLSQVAPLATAPIEAHLMVECPHNFLEQTVHAGASTIVLHPETIGGEVFRMLWKTEELGARAGIALNPETDLEVARYYFDRVSKITVMTVDPGFAGQAFIPAMLKKIERLRTLKEREGHAFLIEADGACNQGTFRDLALAGTEVFVLGTSGLFGLESDISRAWELMERTFTAAIEGLE